jgi:5-methylcytosine-specific restriction protein A
MPRSPYYDTPHWRTLRAATLRAQPNCRCGARATMVDHVKARPRGVGVATSFDVPANLVAICRPCHSRKTAEQDGGFGNPARPPRPTIGRDGWPVEG